MPAFVRNGRLDVIAVNALGRALYSPVFTIPSRPVNLARFCFLDSAARDVTPTSPALPAPPSSCCAPRRAATRYPAKRSAPLGRVPRSL
jgi:hypothetical protein